MRRTLKLRLALIVTAALAFLVPMACGDDSGDAESPTRSEQAAPAKPESTKPVDENKDPGKVTCADLQGPGGGALALVAGNTLASRANVANTSQLQVSNRIRLALEAICKKSGRPEFRPAEEAVKAVKAGKYKTATG